ncbi:MAG TPA: APC family permease [Steroidobacteraceae bacterium]|nr:APC family permease [Steroidobacteraceae bacterium]
MSGLERFGYREQLRRALSTRDLLVYGMIFMVPIAPYGVFGFVWRDAKGMVPLAYLLGLAGMFSTAMSYATMSREFPVAGSVYSYASHGLNAIAGFFAGWLILLDYILVPALLYLISAAALQPLLPAVPGWIWLLGFVAFNAVVNLLGMQLTARINRHMLILELASLALFIGAGLAALYDHRVGGGLTLRPIYDPAMFSLSTVAGATSIAVLSFLGFDGISTLAEESRGGVDSVGRATLLALLLVGTLFIIQTWIASDLARGMHFSSPATAFYQVAARAGGPWLRLATILASVLASGIANAMAAQAAVSRILFAMARDGKLPRVLARVHPKYRTPYVSTIAVALVSLVVGLSFARRIDDLSRVVNFGALSGFMLLHLSVINHCFRRKHSGDWLRHLLLPLAGLLVIGYVLYEMKASAKLLGACWIAIGAVYYLALTWLLRKPAALDV